MAETVAITQFEWEHYNRNFFVRQCYTTDNCINCTINTNTLIQYTYIIIIKYYHDNNKLSLTTIYRKPRKTVDITQS